MVWFDVRSVASPLLLPYGRNFEERARGDEMEEKATSAASWPPRSRTRSSGSIASTTAAVRSELGR
jgi:hypothetical protein